MIFKTEQEARDYSVINPSETVEYKDYHSNGSLYEHSFYVNGELHGEYKDYWDNGQLDEHSFYVNGNPHGEYKLYHKNGQLYNNCFYVNGLYHGEYKLYWSDGKLHIHSFYVNDEEINVDHLLDGNYKSLCTLITLFDGNIHDI